MEDAAGGNRLVTSMTAPGYGKCNSDIEKEYHQREDSNVRPASVDGSETMT